MSKMPAQIPPGLHRRRAAIVVRIAILLVAAFGLFVIMSRDLFPAKYNGDAEKIQAIALGIQSGEGDKAFEFAARVYDLLGLETRPVGAGLLGLATFVAVLLVVLRADYLEEADLLTVATLCAAIVLASLYLGQYSKDVFVLAATLIVGTGRRQRGGREVAVVVVILAMALYVRTYWILILVVYLCFRWAYFRGWRPRAIGIGTLFLYALLAASFAIILGEDLNYGRITVNVFRSDVNTMIVDPFEAGGVLGGILNCLGVAILLILPFPLAMTGPSYMAVAALIAAMWISTLWVGVGYASRPDLRDPLLERSLSILMAMLVTQSLFEPDYGSYVRHLTPLLPLVVLVSTRYRKLAAAEDAIPREQREHRPRKRSG